MAYQGINNNNTEDLIWNVFEFITCSIKDFLG